ncbi:DedA family protein [Yoonia sp. 208BN28-4]|uniref:DedA family protein n=1 Tax=Yoonia sp. 208BN28-4 TaxID=3126505 RepID=UPI0030B7C44A
MFDFITETIVQFGALGIAVLMFAENIFPPIPSELILPLAGYLVADGQMNALTVMVAAQIGTLAGAMPWYWAGQKLGKGRLLDLADRHGRWLTVTRAEMERAFAWFDRNENRAVFLARLVPGLRTVISLPAGMAHMPLTRFLALSAAGSLIWTAVLLAAGFVLQANYARVGAWMDMVVNVALIGLVGVYVWRLIRWRT